MRNLRFLFALVLISIFLAGCSEMKYENPVESPEEDALTKILLNAPDDVRSAVLKEIPEDLRKEISKEISDDEVKLLKRNRLVVAFVKAVSPQPFYDPNGPCAPLLTVAPIIGVGIGTVVNHFTIVESHCFNPQTLEFSNGQAVLSTVQGNHKLYESYYGTLSSTPDPTILIIRGNSTFTGGTGKFNGASGTGFAIGTLNLTNGETLFLNISTLVMD